MPRISYINNRFVEHENAYIHIEDRGYQFSDGVYEVILVKNNKLIDWTPHCTRMRRSLREVRINYAFHDDTQRSIVQELMARNSLVDASIYIQVTRGVAKREHGFPKGNITPTIVMTASALASNFDDAYKNGVSVITTPDIRWKRRDIKTISLLPNILAKQLASENNAIEAILIEEDGYITEGSATNVFIFDNSGILRTHPSDNRILSGITRSGIINVAKQSGINVKEQAFRLTDLMESKGVFISSTTKQLMPVTKVNGTNICGGKICNEVRELMDLYCKYIDNQINNNQ